MQHTHTHTHTHAHTHARTWTRTHTRTQASTPEPICTHARKQARTHTHTWLYYKYYVCSTNVIVMVWEKFLLQVFLRMLRFPWTLTGFTSVFQNGPLFSEEISERRRSRYKCNQSEVQKCVDKIGLSFRKIACQTSSSFTKQRRKAKRTTMGVKTTSTKLRFAAITLPSRS